MRKHQVSFKKYTKEDILNMIAKSNLAIGKLYIPDKDKSIGLVSVNLRSKDRVPKQSLMYNRLLNKMRKLKMDTSGIEEAVRPALNMTYDDLKSARSKYKKGRNTKPMELDDGIKDEKDITDNIANKKKQAENVTKMTLNLQEKQEAVKESFVSNNKKSLDEDFSMTNNEVGVDRGKPLETNSQEGAILKNEKVYGSGGLIGQTAVKDVGPEAAPPPLPPVVNTKSTIVTTPETTLTEQVIENDPILPSISQPKVNEKFATVNEIEKENKERKNKTTERLKKEIKCFRLLYQDLIANKNWFRLQKKSLDVGIKQLRYCHSEYTEEIRKYYNKERGLKVGVIIDPAVLNLNIQGLQSLLSQSMSSSFANNTIINAKQPLMPNETVINPVQPPEPKQVVRPIDVHHRLGGVRHALQQPPQKELYELTHTYNQADRNKMNDIKLHGKLNVSPDNYKNFHRPYYARPKHTSHVPIHIKTGKK